MAGLLKDQFGAEIAQRIAAMIVAVHPAFPVAAFVEEALENYAAQELLGRARKIAAALRNHLPADYEHACELLIRSLGPKAMATAGMGMAPFLYLPHVLFVAEYGLDHFETSMRAQYELTQRFSAEFSIRAYLERYPDATLARLRLWTTDPSVHVRRLVSEGTRPRLPWARRLHAFQADPRPVLELLDLLKDDPEIYVRRSVANNLNDIGKDNPRLLMGTARRWLRGASAQRRRLVEHALRSAIKRLEPEALSTLGFRAAAKVEVRRTRISPKKISIGGKVRIELELVSLRTRAQRVAADLRIHFVKANGKRSAKVFKLKSFELPASAAVALGKTISLGQLSTRKHYPGMHAVDLILNGRVQALGSFELCAGK